MGKNDNRYGKLELNKREGESKKKESKFRRKLEIFGLPPQKNKVETKASVLDDLTPPLEIKAPVAVEVAKEKTVPHLQHDPKRRENLQKKFEDLQREADEYATKSTSIPQYTKYDEKLKHNRQMPESKKRLIRQKVEAAIKREQAQERMKTAQSKMMWGAIIVIGIIVMLYMSGGVGSDIIIELGLTILFAFLGIRGGYGRWWR